MTSTSTPEPPVDLTQARRLIAQLTARNDGLTAQVAALRNALEQALDDMDEDGQCVCLATKDLMRAAVAALDAQGEQHD